MNEKPGRKSGIKQTGKMFEYRVPRDYMRGHVNAHDERVEELEELGYKVLKKTTKGTIMQIPKEEHDARVKAKRDEWNSSMAQAKPNELDLNAVPVSPDEVGGSFIEGGGLDADG